MLVRGRNEDKEHSHFIYLFIFQIINALSTITLLDSIITLPSQFQILRPRASYNSVVLPIQCTRFFL